MFSDTSSVVNKLTLYYTNADNCLNKIDELMIAIQSMKPHILIITEVFPKTVDSSKILPAELNIEGYTFYTNSKIGAKSRGVIIYVRNDIKSYSCSKLDSSGFEESVWCEVKVNSLDTVLVGGIYRSGSSSSENFDNLLTLINTAVDCKCKYILVAGDFNYPEIDWKEWSTLRNSESESFRLLECLRDNYLYQLVSEPTRFREGQTPNILDLIVTNNDSWLDNIVYSSHLGASDHIQICCNFTCSIAKTASSINKRQFYKGNYVKAREELSQVQWNMAGTRTVQDNFSFIKQEIINSIDRKCTSSKE